MPRILFIDDDMSVRRAAQTLLEIEGYEVVVADSGRNGIEAIATNSFDTVIVDIFMPYMDGLLTIKTLNRHAPDVPVIALSALMFRNSSAPARQGPCMSTGLGAAYALQKPFRPRDLLSAIEACLRQRTAAADCREPQPIARQKDQPSGIASPTADDEGRGHQPFSSAG